MSSNFLKFNHNGIKISDGYSIKSMISNIGNIEFKKARDLYSTAPDMEYTIHAMYTVKNEQFGDQIVAICSTNGDPDKLFRFGLPRSYTLEINPNDEGLISDCNSGNAHFVFVKYHSKRFNKDIITVKFV